MYEGKARKIVCKETIKHHLISRISSALKSKIIYYFLARGVLVKKVDKHRCEPITQSRGAGLLVQRSRTAYKSSYSSVTDSDEGSTYPAVQYQNYQFQLGAFLLRQYVYYCTDPVGCSFPTARQLCMKVI